MPIILNKIKKIVILLATIAILTIVWQWLTTHRPWDIRIPIKQESNRPEYSFDKIKVREISGEVTFFNISSAKADFYKKEAFLKDVTGNILTKNKPVLYLEAPSAKFDIYNNNVVLSDVFVQSLEEISKKVRINRRYKEIKETIPVWQLKSNTALWNHRQKTVTVLKPLKIWRDNNSITSDKIIFYSYYNLFVLEPNCTFTNEKYTINSKKATIKENLDLLSFEKEVEFTGEDFTGRAELIEINYKTKDYVFKSDVIFEYKDAIIHADLAQTKLDSDTITMENNVKLLYKNTLINSEKAIIDRVSKNITFMNNIKAWKDKNLLEGELMIYDMEEKNFISTGGRTKFIKSTDN